MDETTPDTDRKDEAWIRGVSVDTAIRIRSLTLILERGVVLTEARLVEHLDETWSLYFRLSDRPGEFRLNQYKVDEPKTYRDVTLAFAILRDDFHYFGPVTASTEKRPAAKA